MENILELFIIFSFSVIYITHILLLERKVSHFGPFPSKTKIIYFPLSYDEEGEKIPAHHQPAALFDYIRRLFGVYKVNKDTWQVVDGSMSERWTCPVCLSFWVAIIPAIVLGLLTNPFIIPVYIFSLSGVSSIVNVNWL